MELTPQQIKDLKRYSLILQASNLEDGLTWSERYYEYSGWEELDGPYYKGRYSNEPGFLPKSIEDFFKDYVNNFNTDEFWNDEFGTEDGSLNFTIVANDNEIVIDRTYRTRESEDSEERVSFSSMVSATPHWWSRTDRDQHIKRLTDDNYVNQLIEEYGNTIVLTYEGGGDDGWVNDQMDSEKKGTIEVPNLLSNMVNEIIELYHSGYENDEGGQGTITLDLVNKYVTIEHENYYEGEDEETIETIKY
jgi:hypothetical protein